VRSRPGRSDAGGPSPGPANGRAAGGEPERSVVWRDRLLAIAPPLVAAAVYANTLSNGFVNDDEHLILLNPWLESLGSIATILGEDAWGFVPGPPIAEFYRPMMHGVFLAIYQLFGPRAWAFHLVNLLLHAGNTWLVARLVARWAQAGAASPRAGVADAAVQATPWVAALLFAVHPVHTEAVAWIAALPELSFTFFGLAALHLDAAPGRPGARRLAATGALFLLALLCKETAITLLVLACVQRGILDGRARPFALDGRRLAPLLVAAGTYFLARGHALTGESVAAGHSWNLGGAGWMLNVLALLADYLGLLLAPVELAYWRPFEPLTSFASGEGVVALVAGAAFAAVALLSWRRSPLTFLALSWIAVPLAPTFLFDRFPRTPFAERYLYLSVLGLGLLAAMAWEAAWRRRALRAPVALALAGITVTLSIATVARNQVWEDAYTLYMDSRSKAPDTPRPSLTLASKLAARGRYDEALAHHRILLALEPWNPAFHSAMAGTLSLAGRSEDALDSFEKAVELAPEDPWHHNLLAIEHARRGEIADAREHFETAVRLAPEEPAYRNNLERLGDAPP